MSGRYRSSAPDQETMAPLQQWCWWKRLQGRVQERCPVLNTGGEWWERAICTRM